MARRASDHRFAATILALLAACGVLGITPVLVRDGANHFSPEAEAAAEARLRELAGEHGILFFVITETDGDQPRMLDAPMADAEADGRPALAVLITGGRLGGIGFSDEFVQPRGDPFFQPDGADSLLADDRGDEALDLIVRSLSAWVRDQ